MRAISVYTPPGPQSRPLEHDAPAMLSFEQLTVRFGRTVALADVTLEVARGEIACLLGPSGSGKTTLLRCAAGIERPSHGRVVIDGIEMAGPARFVEPEQRQVGLVFQDYALFPHLTVEANVAFGIGKVRAEVAELLARLGLADLRGKYPHMLSGGEQQRVALARAMAAKPRVLLMDEPFSSLDSRLRDDVRRSTLEFVRATGTTTVIVTHDPDEAMRIADRVALLDAGRLVQFGTPEDIYARPASVFAARFFSDVSVLPGTCRDGMLETRLGRIATSHKGSGAAFACLRPQHLRLTSASVGVPGRILGAEFRGDCRHLQVAIENLEAPVTVCVRQQHEALAASLLPGGLVHVTIEADDVPVVAMEAVALR
jgi:iron(III) transport system ATP-binding protein